MIAAEQQWNCTALIMTHIIGKYHEYNNLMSKSAAAIAAPAAAVPTPMHNYAIIILRTSMFTEVRTHTSLSLTSHARVRL